MIAQSALFANLGEQTAAHALTEHSRRQSRGIVRLVARCNGRVRERDVRLGSFFFDVMHPANRRREFDLPRRGRVPVTKTRLHQRKNLIKLHRTRNGQNRPLRNHPPREMLPHGLRRQRRERLGSAEAQPPERPGEMAVTQQYGRLAIRFIFERVEVLSDQIAAGFKRLLRQRRAADKVRENCKRRREISPQQRRTEQHRLGRDIFVVLHTHRIERIVQLATIAPARAAENPLRRDHATTGDGVGFAARPGRECQADRATGNVFHRLDQKSHTVGQGMDMWQLIHAGLLVGSMGMIVGNWRQKI